ncbi:MAG: hypothetical protein IJ690_01540 [Clostridia bacterium]|nr:hypothetical protein [Clostridia bacterium]MBR1653625.1 hypothetical protein [Clostridia bacterium]
MSDKLKLTLGIIAGVLGAILLFCLVVVIGCSVNGLTFSQQIVQWFGGAPKATETIVETASSVTL